MLMEALTLHTQDGLTLAARGYGPSDGVVVRRAVIIGPALGVPQRFYEHYAQWLAAHGCAVYTVDWRGIGDSAPSDMRRFRARLSDWPTQDAPAIMDLVASRHPGLPISWFGHSMGGILYGLMPQLPQIDHVVTLGSGSGLKHHLARPLRYAMGLFWHVIVPLNVARYGYFAGQRYNMVADLPKGIVGQWKRWCTHPDFIDRDGPHVRAAYAAVTQPITAVVFTDDEMASFAGIKAVHERYLNASVRYLHLSPRALGLGRVGHFDFFHRRTGPRGWAMSLDWLGVTP